MSIISIYQVKDKTADVTIMKNNVWHSHYCVKYKVDTVIKYVCNSHSIRYGVILLINSFKHRLIDNSVLIYCIPIVFSGPLDAPPVYIANSIQPIKYV